MNRIKISNIRYKTQEDGAYDDHLAADVEIDGVLEKEANFEFFTFFADSHLYDFKYNEGRIPNRIRPLPKINFIRKRKWNTDNELVIDLKLTKDERDKLPKTPCFRNKAIKKLIKKKKKQAKINPFFLEQRENRNCYFLTEKKTSEFYFNTCTCGVHECAGIWNGIAIHRSFKNKTFTYRVINDTDGYERYGILNSLKSELVFPESDILMIRKQLLPFFEHNFKK